MARLLCRRCGGSRFCVAGCSADTATQERQPDRTQAGRSAWPTRRLRLRITPPIGASGAISVSRSLAIPTCTNRDISFIVANGDVSVTGIVRTEEERTRINDLAMDIDGVKSVANALRVAE